jgi:hypothetical protein
VRRFFKKQVREALIPSGRSICLYPSRKTLQLSSAILIILATDLRYGLASTPESVADMNAAKVVILSPGFCPQQ